MVESKSSKPKSITRETEYGYFIREKTRIGKKRRQKTVRPPKNREKVVLDRIGDLEFYVYPYSYPDRVFVGIYPLSIILNKEDYKRLFGIGNKIRWYLDKEWVKKPKTEKEANRLRRYIVEAYNFGLSKLKERVKG